MHLCKLENICEKKEPRLSCNEILSDPFANGIMRIDNTGWLIGSSPSIHFSCLPILPEEGCSLHISSKAGEDLKSPAPLLLRLKLAHRLFEGLDLRFERGDLVL